MKKHSKILTIVVWVAFVITLALTFYVNHYMPHGPSYYTGDYVCENDGRGPCGEERREDLRNVDIPEWAKFLKTSYILPSGVLLVLGLYLSNKNED